MSNVAILNRTNKVDVEDDMTDDNIQSPDVEDIIQDGDVDDIIDSPEFEDIKEVSEKEGNYILTFGKTSCGKSALQQHLIRWLLEENKDATSHLVPTDDSWDAHVLLEKWKDRWDLGRFPDRTVGSSVREFKINVVPRLNKANPLEFSFLEIAGEKFHNVIARDGNTPNLPSSVSEFFESDGVNLCIVLVCDGGNPRPRGGVPGDDQLFRSFLDYLRVVYNGKFDSVPVLLVVTKWDKVVRQNMKGGSFTIDDFVNKYLRGTRSKLEGRPKGTVLFSEFSVGAVEERAVDKNERGDAIKKADYIRKVNFQDIDYISKWIYRVFTGKEIHKKSKFKKWIRILGA